MTTKLYGISDTDFKNFIERINKFNSKYSVVATQTHIVKDTFYAIIYYDNKKETIIYDEATKEPEDKPTESQVKFLTSKKIEIPKTKHEAWELISKLKKGYREQ